MRRSVLAAAALVVLLSASSALAADEYGQPLTLKETTKVSAILDSPEQ